jgi:CO/xanthine dehydrogenase Mo-binding subunit
VDAAAKVLGEGMFADDVICPACSTQGAAREVPRARVKKIDLTRALALPDCFRILTPGRALHKPGTSSRLGRIDRRGRHHPYGGDAIVLAASEKREALDEILSLVTSSTRCFSP